MTREPQACQNMAELRAEIDRIDRELIAALARRAGYIDRAVALKREAGLPARIEARVGEVMANARAEAEAAGLDPALVDALWRQIVEWSIAREARGLGGPGGRVA